MIFNSADPGQSCYLGALKQFVSGVASNFNIKIAIIFRSLKYRNYRLFFGGQSISLIGTWMQRIAMPWLVYSMTGSAFQLGLISFAGQVPTFLLAPFAGVITDKFPKYRILLITQVISLLQAAVLAIMALTGAIQIWQIIFLSVVLGCVNAFDTPSRQSFVIEMVEKKEDLGNAIALNSMMFNGARIIGPSIAGIILATAGEGICFLINSVSYVFVILSLLGMKVAVKERQKKAGTLLGDLKEGLDYTFGFAPIRHLLLLLASVSLMGSSYQVLMPVFAKEVLGGSSATFGFLMGSAGFGALAGALLLASRETTIKLGKVIPYAAAMFGAGLASLSFSRHFPVSLFLMLVTGLSLMVYTASSNTILQTITDDDKRGRVMSFYTLAIMGTAPFGSLLAGTLARLLGTPGAILAGGLCCIAGAFIFYKKLPGLKENVRPLYEKMGLIPEVVTGINSASEPVVDHVRLREREGGNQ